MQLIGGYNLLIIVCKNYYLVKILSAGEYECVGECEYVWQE